MRKINSSEKIISATLKLAEARRWQDISIENIAEAAKVKLNIVNKEFSSKLMILDAFNRQLDRQMAKDFSDIEITGSIREKLFEILMYRFDTLDKYKKALKSIYKGTVPFDPLASTFGLKNLNKSMEVALNITGTPTRTPIGCIKTKFLLIIFIRSFITWLEDDSPDMAKTMSKLDDGLAKAEILNKNISGVS